MAVDEPEGLLERGDADDAEHGPEDLLVVDLHARLDVVEEADAEIEAVRVLGVPERSAVHDQLGALGHALVYPLDD